MLEQEQQRSSEWRQRRGGKFTSSRISELLGQKGLGKTGESYAFEMAVEIVEGIDLADDYQSFDMIRGVELEPIAFDKFALMKSMEFISVEKCGFFTLNKDTGGSPDGLVDGNGVLEIKCPKPNKFFRLVVDSIIDQAYIDQMQHQMLCTGRELAYHFNYLVYNGMEKWHEIVLPRDDKRIALIEERIKQAVEIRDEFVDKLRANRQY